jgi:hypothetical protein
VGSNEKVENNAATKNSLRLLEQNVLATTTKKRRRRSLEIEKKRELEQVQIALQVKNSMRYLFSDS